MYTFKILCIAAKIQIKQANFVTQEPTFVMVVTQEPTTKIYKKEKKKKEKISATHAFQNHGMIYCYIPSSCKAELQSQKLKRESMHSCMRTCK